MSFRLIALSPVVDAAPGEVVVGRVEIHNDGASGATYAVQVVGLDAGPVTDAAPIPPTRIAVDAGQSAIVEVPIQVPVTLGVGAHATAFEATSSSSNDRPVLTPFTLSIGSVARVDLEPIPSTIRGRRRAKFHLDITNHEAEAVDVAVTGEAPDVDVDFAPAAFTLRPGQRAVAKGSVRGPRHWSGEPTQHNLVITARGRASSTSVTAAYVQRPVFAHRLRMLVAAVTVVALWVAAVLGVAVWLSNRDDGSDATADDIIGVDTDGDGIVDTFRDADGNPIIGTDTDGDGIPDTFVDANGNPIGGTDTDGDGIPDTLKTSNGSPIEAIDTDGDGIPDALSDGSEPADDTPTAAPEPKSTILRGTVKIDGDPSSVTVDLTPLALGAAPDEQATPIGFRGTEPEQPNGKIWSTRYGVLPEALTARRTLAIEPAATQPGVDGVWLFSDVLQGQSYEVSFSKPGFDTQSFVVTPAEDGEPIDLDVEMTPARGAISGTVTGPSGALGGAAINITDGTLSFTTTSETGTGAWSIEGVSTPGVYTMSATLRGYGTAVRQIELAAGDDASGVTLPMSPGLGTITGRVVDSSGSPIGGVTISAANGDTVLTSTSLTDGDVGFFSLPQLAVPATYTVTAELDGYVPQTRRVPLNGSAGGVDFTMTSETITLRGRVVSSTGGGVESAGLIISTGDLTFRSSTSVRPVAGIFEIDRLPPGTYTITVEHYEHESATEFLTIEPGTSPPPLNITLGPSSGPPDIGRTSLSVKVINNDPTGPPIEDAVVTIKRNRVGEAAQSLPGANALGVTFENLRVGTYTVVASKEGYNTSQGELKTVGLAPEEMTIPLQQLGSASGTIVDVNGTRLGGYEVTLQRLDDNGDVDAAFGPFQPNAADGVWSTPANNRLPTGTYRVVVNKQPTGYLVRTNQTPQVVPPELARPNLQFVVPRVTEAATPSLQIQLTASQYPTLTGNVFKPRLQGTVVEYDPLDSNFTATGTCNGTTIPAEDIVYADVAGGNGNDRFSISGAALADLVPAAALPASCELTITAPGRVADTVTIDDINVGTVTSSGDRSIATALALTPTPFRGTVFWLDEGGATPDRVPLDATFATATDVITGFRSTVSAPGGAATTPAYNEGPVSGATSPTGEWTIAGHMFGPATFRFTADDFTTPGALPVTIDQNGRTVQTGTHAGAVITDDGATGIGVELRPPDEGLVTGTVTIQTNGTPTYPADMVVATDASDAERIATPNANGQFEFTGAIPGFWSIDFVTPPNHRLDTATPVTKVVQPGATPATSGFDATFTELATVSVRFLDKFTGLPITPAAGFVLTGSEGTVTRAVGAADGDGRYTVTDVPVAATNPTNNAVTYEMTLNVPDHDVRRAQVSQPLDTISVTAGATPEIEVWIAPYRALSSRLVGHRGAIDVPLRVDAAAPEPATIEIVPVDAYDNDRTTEDPLPVVSGNADGTFTVTGATGYYRITASHPAYTATVIPPDPLRSIFLPAAPGVFFLPENTGSALDDFEFEVRRGELSLEAVQTLASGSQVNDVTYHLYRGSTCAGAGNLVETADFDGEVEIDDLVPGAYCIELNRFDPGDPSKRIAFPAVIRFTIPEATEAGVGQAAIVAPLPPLATTVTGKLVAQNTLTVPTPIDLNAATAPVVTSSWDSADQVQLNGTTIPNEPPESNPIPGDKSATSVEKTDAISETIFWEYTFEQVPFGTHDITAPSIAGYELVSTNPAANFPVNAVGPIDGPTFVYRAVTSDLEIDIGAGTFPSLDGDTDNLETTVTLENHSGTITYTDFELDTTTVPSTNLLVIKNVAPESKQFTLNFDDRLHAPVSNVKFKLPAVPGTNGNRRVSITPPNADRVRLTGTARLQTAPDTYASLAAGAQIRLGTNTLTAPAPPVTPDAGAPVLIDDTYIFDVPVGNYALTMEQSGYVPRPSENVNLATAGTVVTKNLTIDRLAKVTVVTTSNGLPNPPGFRVELVNTANNNVYGGTPCSPTAATCGPATPANPGGTPPIASGTYEFNVPAGTYQARARGTGYPNQLSSTSSVLIGDGHATAKQFTVALPRLATVDVTGPGDGTGVNVTLGGVTQTDATSFTFSDSTGSAGTSIASTGALTGTASAPGFRTRSFNVAANLATATTVDLLPTVTVTGTIPGAPLGTDVVEVTDGTTTLRGDVYDDNGVRSYSVSGLGVGTDWVVSYDQPGVGHTPTPLDLPDVTATSANTIVQNITLTVRSVNYQFTVTKAPPAPTGLANATVSIADGTGTIDSDVTVAPNGNVTLQAPENRAPTTWTVTHDDYLSRSGPMSAVPSPILLSPAITGSVTDDGTAAPGASVRICPATSSEPCSGTGVPTTSASGAGATFKFTTLLTETSYKVWAVIGTGPSARSASMTVTIGAGTTTRLPANGVINVPA